MDRAGTMDPQREAGAVLRGRRVELRPVRPTDYQFLYDLELGLEHTGTWRSTGRTLSPEQALHDLWVDVLAQYVVVDRSSGSRVGLVKAYAASFEHGFAHLAAMGPRLRGVEPSLLLEGCGMLLDEVFARWAFRKVYAVALEPNHEMLVSGLRGLLREEGRLRAHVSFRGATFDQITSAIYRADWEAVRPHAQRFLAPREVGPPAPATEFASCEELAEELLLLLGLDADERTDAATSLWDDWGLDSLQAFELFVILETLAGASPSGIIPELYTVADAFAYYRSARST